MEAEAMGWPEAFMWVGVAWAFAFAVWVIAQNYSFEIKFDEPDKRKIDTSNS